VCCVDQNQSGMHTILVWPVGVSFCFVFFVAVVSTLNIYLFIYLFTFLAGGI